MQDESSTALPRFVIIPEPARVDETVNIRLIYLLPEQLVTLRMTICDEMGRIWDSWAMFRANTHGVVDVSEQPPLAGSYTECDAMGLFWSLQPLNATPSSAFSPFKSISIAPLSYELSAEVANQRIAVARHERFFWNEQQVRRQPLSEHGLIGTMFTPRKFGSFPCLLLLSGSSGALREQEAALLATYGYVVVALAYFGVNSLPSHLQEIPLEYFIKAVQWLRHIDVVAHQKIAVIGISKGAEGALLLGATVSEIAAVVAYAPSAYVYQGLGEKVTSSWSYHDQPLPFVTYKPAPIFEAYEKRQLAEGAPIAYRTLYLETLQHTDELARAAILVERIQGPILLISGEDDQMWPGTLFAEEIEQRLRHHHHPYWHQHVSYAHAGHKIGMPNVSTTLTQLRHQFSGSINDYGGTPQGNARASAHSWQMLLTFLKHHMH
ncbi:acyl-CoA thioesterase/bile acid-CoA:amino acid N-acyltransferase family protein [Tengunoibacter tsumagoiensis]|uniref:Acyl-CoA thioesterase n=1 Tax=Tengunoibacter tsumagoiensis TaxID=2014871 RepID=A0A402A979_9CHLR|nr:acyl-CoA thioesterase/bile acid-CoA:amino acid N-acyltransferase family protein [Tengunoibacter tsumagoiensis]GCE15501.1 acyl-CoA thioesterase [Tengunoibacter tsumagoiensis]